MELRRATLTNLDTLAPLFDSYRQFYRQPGDLPRARRFLEERLGRGESVVFLALEEIPTGALGLGFVQLYPTYSSISAGPQLILADLYVTPESRGRGVGRALLNRARDHGLEVGAGQIVLQTAHDNTAAQALYESLGYRMDTVYRVYELNL